MSQLHGSIVPPITLQDLCCRFISNSPVEDRNTTNHLMCLIENAYWYYEDHILKEDSNSKPSLESFTTQMFNHCTVLRPFASSVHDMVEDFGAFKNRVPVMGAIILDENFERCLMVRAWSEGTKKPTWGFPRGKKNINEEDHVAAIREVLEETGCDISKLLKKEEFLEAQIMQKRVRLYIVTGVTNDTSFAPLTEKEISEIIWQRIRQLQYDDTITVSEMVSRFLDPLKLWIKRHPSCVPETSTKRCTSQSVWKRKAAGGNRTATLGFKKSETVNNTIFKFTSNVLL